MRRPAPSSYLIAGFIAIVVIASAAVIVVIHAVTESWVSGGVAAGIAGGITAASYPVLGSSAPV